MGHTPTKFHLGQRVTWIYSNGRGTVVEIDGLGSTQWVAVKSDLWKRIEWEDRPDRCSREGVSAGPVG